MILLQLLNLVLLNKQESLCDSSYLLLFTCAHGLLITRIVLNHTRR